MADLLIRKTGRAGRITLTRPKALNAVSYEMVQMIDAALIDWADDDDVTLVVIDAEGERAFSAGGDIQELYDRGRAGDFAYGQKFWADEYRLNARIADYPKPYVALCQGFTMGGGVGVSLHGSHRIVGESSQVAMPECGIGLVPDVGGSLLLARAPGRLGEYLGLTGARMGPGDAIRAGFADHFVPEADWPELIRALEATGDAAAVAAAAKTAPEAKFAAEQRSIDKLFAWEALADIEDALADASCDFAAETRKLLLRPSPLSMAATLRLIHAARAHGTIRKALGSEYCFTFRCQEHGEFLEGIRAQVIDRDRNPQWMHKIGTVPQDKIDAMLAPLGDHALRF